MECLFPHPKIGSSFLEILRGSLTRKLLGFDAVHAEKVPFVSGVASRLKFLLNDTTNQLSFLEIGYTSLEAFLQANCTGPPLDVNPEESIFPEAHRNDLKITREEILEFLSVDGSQPYPLTPHIELFWLAKVIMSNPVLAEAGFNGRRARFRINYWHQKLLSEESATLHDIIYSDADVLEHQLISRLAFNSAAAEEHFVEFLVERATIRTYYGDDSLARADLARAATIRQFQFALTGVLGKRTKFQDRDVSQLVVLAKSRDHGPGPESSRNNSKAEDTEPRKSSADADRQSRPKTPDLPLMGSIAPPSASMSQTPATPKDRHEHTSPLPNPPTKPDNLPLNDDTLLEKIHFKSNWSPVSESTMTRVISSDSSLSPQLSSLDPSNQPLLSPMDSIILLAIARSISNTSPSDGLVREETLPYATRVLEGGSSNWQVYTQALLVRSRIEGYRSRTAERGLLQLQALVDQVIVETSETPPPTASKDPTSGSTSGISSTSTPTPNTFLPKPSASESATVAERMKYIYQLSPPLRWELEAELAARWTHMGGLKTALEIYERLQMHAEVALCLAATDREDQAVKSLKGLLFDNAPVEPLESDGSNSSSPKTLKLRSPPPADAPRLLCILGDITGLPSYYTLSWTISSCRYARAQRSLGRYYSQKRDFQAAADAYSLALNISRLDRASWFALGCVQLELQRYMGATESFTRCVQLDDKDAEAWSNLAVALAKLPRPSADVPQTKTQTQTRIMTDDETAVSQPSHVGDEGPTDPLTPPSSSPARADPYRHVREALRALRRAATLKRDDARIWDNYLTVAASIPPSADTPWNEIIQAMGQVVELRGKKEGERAVDLTILKVLVEYVTQSFVYPDSAAAGESGSRSGKDESSIMADKGPHEPKTTPEVPTNTYNNTTLPYTPRAFLSLIDNQITPLATSSSQLYSLLSTLSLWRHRPSQSLLYAETSWRLHLTSLSASEEFDNLSERQWESVVDKTIWMVKKYEELGPMERERTGGEVESKWRFKARSAVRRVLGRGKNWEGTKASERLRKIMEEGKK
ncbi:uncharacterized protein Z518_07645 [Rhinocladiella mackenziei CBS 650.93]|uniref:TPR-like protein n=1 Tax=Rhinocladiella mackenziei CBS 650.93 TaxID=1442369 RepID=A0A0D2FPI2_9EURO|nr:uncharacterized protein Z518_07645 [Rhinocladiella mackenziei CBS 650.93]KIX04092.1 hypothetical protein Z518_07645 [Rhinocladiella mackenziei CBS 650.93]